MIEHVTDIASMLQSIQCEVKSMRDTIDSQQMEISRLTRSNQRLTKENRELRQRLSNYKEPPKNSSNSSTPPSKESIKSEAIRRTRSLRQKSDKSTGGQIGHIGFTLEKVDNPDEIIDHQSDYCQACGVSLCLEEPILEYVAQEIDLPIIKPLIKEHRHYVKKCQCGCINRPYGARKRGGNSITYSKNIQALVIYLNVVQCIPYERLQSTLKTLFDLEMSQGTIKNFLQSSKIKLELAIQLIKKAIEKSKIVGFDESGCYCNGRLDWSWIAQTPQHTLVFRENSRAGRVLDNMFGQALKNMTAVTDRHAAYFALDFKNHQICLAHILRELQYLNELDDKQQWSKDLQDLIREAIHLRNQNRNKTIDSNPWLTRLDKILSQNVNHLKKEYHRLKKGLIKCRDYIFLFLENPAIPFDNNGSERGIRKLKIKQKTSGAFRSENGADAFMALHSITDTAWKTSNPRLRLYSLCYNYRGRFAE